MGGILGGNYKGEHFSREGNIKIRRLQILSNIVKINHFSNVQDWTVLSLKKGQIFTYKKVTVNVLVKDFKLRSTSSFQSRGQTSPPTIFLKLLECHQPITNL